MSQRPLRGLLEKATDSIPQGPLGVLGSGNAIGGAGYFTVSAINGIVPVDGLDVGYEVKSRETELEDGIEEHTFLIYSASKDVARFVAKYQTSPTNINFIREKPEVTSVEKVQDDIFFPLWRVTSEREIPDGLSRNL